MVLEVRQCDCDAVRACCLECFDNGGGERCCNTTCMDRFPECHNAC